MTGSKLYAAREADAAADRLHPQRGDLYGAGLLVATRQQRRRYPHLPAPELSQLCYSLGLDPGKVERYSDLAGRCSHPKLYLESSRRGSRRGGGCWLVVLLGLAVLG